MRMPGVFSSRLIPGLESFLGTQGYVWDTQSDMAWALAGAIAALAVLGKMHDRQLRKRGYIPTAENTAFRKDG